MDLFEPNTAQNLPLNQPITPEELGPLIDELLSLGVPMSEIEAQVMALSTDGAPAPAVRAAVNSLRSAYQGRAYVDTASDAVDQTFSDMMGYIDERDSMLADEEDRIGGLLSDPGKIRSDVQLGKILARRRGEVQAAEDEAMTQIGNAIPGFGVRSSGSAADAAQRVKQSSATAKSGIYGDILDMLQGQYQGVQDQRRQIPLLKSDVEAGRIPATFSFLDSRLGTIPNFDPYEAPGYALGNYDYDRGESTERFGAVTGGVQNAADAGFDIISEIMGGRN